MKRLSTLSVLFTLNILSVNAQPVFQKTFAGSVNYTGTRATSATSGIIVAGTRGSSLGSPEEGILMKTDLSGTISWTKAYGASGNEIFNIARQTSDGGYIAAGYTTSSGAGGRDVLVVKTDASGNISWAKTYGTVDDEIAYDIIQTTDGGYILTGDAKKINAQTTVGAIYLLKLTSTGTESWSKMWGAGIGNYGYNVIQTSDGGYMVGGRANNGFFSFIKTDASGNISFARASMPIGIQAVDFSQMIQTSDGGYAVVGTGTNTSNDAMIVFEKLDATATVTFAKTYNPGTFPMDIGFGLMQTWNGGYTIIGYSGNFAPNFANLYILNISSTGVVASAKTSTAISYGYTVSFAVSPLSDGGFAATGTNGTNMVLFKGDGMGNTGCTYTTASATENTPTYFDNAITNWTSSGTTITNTSSVTASTVTLTPTSLCSGVGIEETEISENIEVYPNPASDELNIDVSGAGLNNSNITVEIYNSVGEIVQTQNIFSGNIIRVPVSGLENGIYFVKINTEGKFATKTVIVQR
ncbi:MAG: T9SS type A sorting domain-containing protein [Bacteroidota bacterium]